MVDGTSLLVAAALASRKLDSSPVEGVGCRSSLHLIRHDLLAEAKTSSIRTQAILLA